MHHRLYLFFKKSSYTLLSRKKMLKRVQKSGDLFFGDIEDAHRQHEEAKQKLTAIVENLKIPYSIMDDIWSESFNKENELIVTLGGDGTFIHASHFSTVTPILGINSAPGSSIGHYCSMTIDEDAADIAGRLESIIRGREKPSPVQRMVVYKNNAPTDFPFINDALFANTNPGDTSRYTLELDGIAQKQKSSGIWISTSSGSTAAFSSAGGKPFGDYDSGEKIQYGFIVRELYEAGKKSIRYGILTSDNQFGIISRMFYARVFLDGRRNYVPVHYGDNIRFGFYPYPLMKY